MSDTTNSAKPSLSARWTSVEDVPSASGARQASALGQWSWAWYEGARNPHVLLITIYIFAPYFALHLMSDPIAGQALWADLNTLAGVIIALVAPILGAVADAGGRRKPWLLAFSIVLGLTAASLWYALPNEQGLPFFLTCILLVVRPTRRCS